MLASPAKAQEASQPRGLAKAGPINPENGFPFWYEDHAGNRLDLCLDSDETTSKCLVPFELPEQAPEGWQPGDDFIFPDYFPGEAFWWTGEAQIERPDGGRALLVLAAESAFANEDPKEGDQMSFGRIRVRLDQLVPGATYKVTHPYGVDEIVAEEDGSIFVTEDIGCFPSPLRSCNFDKALNGRLGPFLTWAPVDGTPDPRIPAGYIADPDIPHQVQGSPITAPADPTDPNSQQVSADFFRVEGPGLGTPEKPYIETDLFSVTGKTAKLQVDATGIGAERADTAFNDADQKIELVASDEAAEVYYTTDGSEPGVADPDTG